MSITKAKAICQDTILPIFKSFSQVKDNSCLVETFY